MVSMVWSLYCLVSLVGLIGFLGCHGSSELSQELLTAEAACQLIET